VQSSPSNLLSTSSARDGTTLVLTCIGSAETEALDTLSQALSGLHEDAVRDEVRTVIADIRSLEFASSSCLKVFVTWLQRVSELDDTRRYRIVFRSNPAHSWQRRSLGALAAFASGVVQIESEVR
jgi:hypothetical protein